MMNSRSIICTISALYICCTDVYDIEMLLGYISCTNCIKATSVRQCTNNNMECCGRANRKYRLWSQKHTEYLAT